LVLRSYLIFIFGIIALWARPLQVYAYPERIISLGTAVTEELYLLGAGDRIVGDTVYCNRPEDAKKKEKVGTVINVNVEKIVSLKPDLVFATSLTDRQQIRKLKELKINVAEMAQEQNFEGICANFLKVGELVGKYPEAEKLVNEIKAKVNSIREKSRGLPNPKVMAQIGANPLFVASRGYFIHDFIEMSGGINIAKDAPNGQYSREEALRQNPDIILITTMGMTGEQEKISWEKYRSLNAVKNARIYIIDSDKLCSVTPVSFVETLQEIVRILHPEMASE
jgi:iron complex transport system substrate-binding protein